MVINKKNMLCVNIFFTFIEGQEPGFGKELFSRPSVQEVIESTHNEGVAGLPKYHSFFSEA